MSLVNGSESNDDQHEFLRPAVIATMTVVLTFLCYRGLDVVGNVAIVLCLLSLLPFAIFCIVGLPKVNPSRWLEGVPFKEVDWRLLLNTFFWYYSFSIITVFFF
jgi:amino acid transporter